MCAEFDRHAGSYEALIADSIGFAGQRHGFYLRVKARHLLELARRELSRNGPLRALDVGCGPGLLHSYLTGLGELHGIDVSESMIEAARKANPEVRYHVGDGSALPFEDGEFDLSFASCVLHHVPPGERNAFLAELCRVTRVGGLVVIVEHNPLNPLTRLAVHRCVFDEDAVLAGRAETRRRLQAQGLRIVGERSILFFPWGGALFARLEQALGRLPLGAQYYVAGRA